MRSMFDPISLVLGAALVACLWLGVSLYYQRRREVSHETNREQHQALMEQVSEASKRAMTESVERLVAMVHEVNRHQNEQADRLMGQRQKAIDNSVANMTQELASVRDLVNRLEKEREAKLGELSVQLKSTSDATLRLQETASDLHRALSSSQKRGKWGERMAEDVLRAVGLVEGVNYTRQTSLPGGRGRPDYTFLLPHGLVLHMDVKFPFENYYKMLQSEDTLERDKLKTQFLRDVKQRIREVSSKDYISPDSNTVDYALVFIPNEQVYAYIQEADVSIVDEALSHRVVLCSPLTLYAILALVRRALDSFKLEQAASEILELLAGFTDQWHKFVEVLDRLGRRLDDAQKDYGILVTTRKRQLERQLERVEAVKDQDN